MTIPMVLVLVILAAAIILLVTEWIPMEATALLVLGSVALTGLVSPAEALSGFSNPAVVTVWAVFILSGGLTRTGVADALGRRVLRLAGRREATIVLVIMTNAGVMSAFMNNVAVAALMLPVVMDIARQTGHPPSRLLLPLAYGSLLGGLTTLIGTPPNILASEALREGGLEPFGLFDYTPVGLAVMAAGIAFMTLVGRHLLPRRNVSRNAAVGPPDLQEQYDLRKRMHVLRIPVDSALVGQSLAQSRIGSALGLNVVEIIRNGHPFLAPNSSAVLRAGDDLLIEGRLERMKELSGWRELAVAEEVSGMESLFAADFAACKVQLSEGSLLAGKTLNEIDFRSRFGAGVLTILRNGELERPALQDEPLQAGDVLLLHGPRERLGALQEVPDFSHFKELTRLELSETYRLHEGLLTLRVPEAASLVGRTLRAARLGDALGLRVLGILRRDGALTMPESDEELQGRDCLIVRGRREELRVLQGLAGLEVERELAPEAAVLESARIGMVEAVLSPHTTLAGKTLRQLNFREKFDLSVLAIWRSGRAYRSDLRDMTLCFGDALLLYGPREQLRVLGREPDFLVLTQALQEVPRLEKARVAAGIMGGVLVPVLLGLVPIYIAAVLGAAFMVLTRCLNMEEAYRAIEWKAVFLIAGLLPLGLALDRTGVARFLAEGVVTLAGPYGPSAVLAGLLVLTFLATCIIPTAALVVLMAPIVLNAAAGMGISTHALMMVIAMAASASFMTPVSHPANILVMGPGGYRFRDYIKVGLPLTLVAGAAVLLAVPFFWPLSP